MPPGLTVAFSALILLLPAGRAYGSVTTSFGCHDYTLVGNVGLLTVGTFCSAALSFTPKGCCLATAHFVLCSVLVPTPQLILT